MSANDPTADLYFTSAIRAAADRSCTRLLPLAELKEPLAPHDRFAQRMLLALQSLGYIEPELSPSWANDWLHGRDWLFRGFENVSWRILRSADEAGELLRAWDRRLDISPDTLRTWATVWEDLALAEVVEFSRCSLAETGFDPNWALAAIDALQACLTTFSVHQSMYLVHIALRSLALQHRRATPRDSQPGRTFSRVIRNYVRRASTEGWAIRGMSHATDQQRSAIAVLFAETITGLGERYYTERPSLDAIAQAVSYRGL